MMKVEQPQDALPKAAAPKKTTTKKKKAKKSKDAVPERVPTGLTSSEEDPTKEKVWVEDVIAKKRPNRGKKHKERMGLTQLPKNVLRMIAENVNYYGGRQRDIAMASGIDPRVASRKGLMSLRISCRMMSKVVTPILFRRIKLHSNIESASHQALGISQSQVSRYIRKLILPTSCAMPRGLPEKYETKYRDTERRSDFSSEAAKALFNMRETDASMFPLMIISLFNTISWSVQTLKLQVGDVIPINYDQEYSNLFVRTLSFAMRTIEMPALQNVQFTHPELFQELDMIREIKPFSQLPPPTSTFPSAMIGGQWKPSNHGSALDGIRGLRFAINNQNVTAVDRNLNLGTLLTTSLKGLALRGVENLSISLGVAFRVTNLILRPTEYLKSISLTGYINVPRSSIIRDAVRNCTNLTDLHLRGVCISSTSGEDVTWTPLFQACAEKETLTGVRFELLSHTIHFDGPHVATLFRAIDLPAPKMGELDLWMSKYNIWRPLVTKNTAELEALETMRCALIKRRVDKKMKVTKWLQLCGEDECKKAL